MSQLAPVQNQRRTEFIGTHVDEETRARLVALARREDRSVSAVLRRAVDRELERVHRETEEAAA
jgi:predicted transcriptional regulator